MTPSKTHRKGFTLVELLVVILIIAALAALIMTVANRMRQSANHSVITANLRQLGVALVTFTSDNGRFPSKSGDPVWDRCLFPYLGYNDTVSGTGNINASSYPNLDGVAKVFASPNDKETITKNTFRRSFAIVPWTTNWSDGTAFRGWKNLPYNQGIRYSVLSAPEKNVMVVQWYSNSSSVANVLGSGNHAYHDLGGPSKTLGATQQMLFADGHIDKEKTNMTNAQFVAKYWPGTIGTAN
jgi:prepilin-type N-terminal cleavage/methylation domain-containing protein